MAYSFDYTVRKSIPTLSGSSIYLDSKVQCEIDSNLKTLSYFENGIKFLTLPNFKLWSLKQIT